MFVGLASDELSVITLRIVSNFYQTKGKKKKSGPVLTMFEMGQRGKERVVLKERQGLIAVQ